MEGDRKGTSVWSLCLATLSVQIPWEKDSPLRELMALAQGVPAWGDEHSLELWKGRGWPSPQGTSGVAASKTVPRDTSSWHPCPWVTPSLSVQVKELGKGSLLPRGASDLQCWPTVLAGLHPTHPPATAEEALAQRRLPICPRCLAVGG